MNTAIKNLLKSILLLTITLSSPAILNAKETNKVTVLNQVRSFNKLNVAGNVEVILVQSAEQKVQVYDNYYSKNALVQERNGELRISSFEKETLTVVVYASQLSEISASGNANIKTSGKFSTLSLALNLKDQAKAILNTNSIDVFANVKGEANLALTGTVTDYKAIIGSMAIINLEGFTAENSSIIAKNTAVAQQKVHDDFPAIDELYTL
jgi:hypothetical protein